MNGIRGEFKDYEKKALALFKKHGGEVLVAYAPEKENTKLEYPDEIQILRIENRTKFEEFMKDQERLKMAGERTSVIRKTEVYLSEEIIDYST
ncbi:hypothetical protein [Oscillatoria sp. FACHB-1406]|uniref:hypothetical protein n=1 Tax=Oscillatoria sp. FACHB-1406 TaxID=2692846 RepID=UPI001683FC9D|nr:hypothetical protein [Oscillatoria sp. FACHB-1406]MBD2579436.1 hypothetical protein [Oscillatoria sp. FACHB-1406]